MLVDFYAYFQINIFKYGFPGVLCWFVLVSCVGRFWYLFPVSGIFICIYIYIYYINRNTYLLLLHFFPEHQQQVNLCHNDDKYIFEELLTCIGILWITLDPIRSFNLKATWANLCQQKLTQLEGPDMSQLGPTWSQHNITKKKCSQFNKLTMCSQRSEVPEL